MSINLLTSASISMHAFELIINLLFTCILLVLFYTIRLRCVHVYIFTYFS